MSLDIKSREERGVTVVVPRGRLTLDYGSRLHDQVKRVVEGGARRVLIDLSAVDYVDSHGLGQMVACQTTLRRHEGQLRFAGLNEKVHRLMEMTSIPRILQFDSDLPTGLSKLAGTA